MSDRGSPSDHTGADKAITDDTAPASAGAEGGAASPGSGDANLDAAASSADGDQGAKQDAPKPTLADVIKTAVAEGSDEKVASPAPVKDGSKVEGDDAAAKADGEHKPEDDAKLPFHNHPRWKQVIGENAEIKAKVATLEPAAQQFEKIESFMTQHQLTHEEVGEGFIIMAMAKAGDPRVIQKLDDFRNKVALAIGEAVPADIQEQIDSGALTEAAGKELAKTRAQLKMTEAQTARRSEADAEKKAKDDADALKKELQGAVTAWDAEQRKIDPDFAKKESAIARYSRALILEHGQPRNREEAVNLVKAAYAEVNKDFGAVIPQKQAAKHVPSAPSSHGASQQPKSLREAVARALQE